MNKRILKREEDKGEGESERLKELMKNENKSYMLLYLLFILFYL